MRQFHCLKLNHVFWVMVLAVFGCETDNESDNDHFVVNAPTDLHITATSDSNIGIAWIDNSSDETGFRIERSTNDSLNFVEVAQLANDIQSYLSSSLSQNTRYYFRVRAVKEQDYSGYSNLCSSVAVFNRPPDIPEHPYPGDGTTNIAPQIMFNWVAIDSDQHQQSFEVYWGESFPPTTRLPLTSVAGFHRGNLQTSATYYWYVRVYDELGVRTTGPIWNFTTGNPSCAGWCEQSWGENNGHHVVNLVDLDFVDEQVGWVVGNAYEAGRTFGLIMKTNDGGRTWNTQEIDPFPGLVSVDFVDREYGWAVGKDGTILHTSDGGIEWVAQGSSTHLDLYDCRFVSRQKGWAVGESGVILATLDEGQTWQPQQSGTTGNLRSISCVGDDHCWIAGWTNRILRTSNSGSTWTGHSYPGGTFQLYAVDFVDSLNGFAVGVSSVVVKTTDGGVTWQELTRPAPSWSLYGVDFLSSTRGWSVCRQNGAVGGAIFFTNDGGNTWVQQLPPRVTTLGKVQFLNDEIGWCLGDENTVILNTNTGGN